MSRVAILERNRVSNIDRKSWPLCAKTGGYYCRNPQYDHNFVLNPSKMMPAAVAVGDRSGIVMKVYTTEPGLQFYSGNFMEGRNKLRTGVDAFRTAFCLETQHFPDSPNHTGFPSTVLRPGSVYRSRSVYAFSVDKAL